MKSSIKVNKEVKNSMTSSQLFPHMLTKLELLSINSRRSCEYRNLCTSFKNSLGIPSGFFEKVIISRVLFFKFQQFHQKFIVQVGLAICFCETCHKLRGCSLVSTAGNPPKNFTLPIRWVIFPLKLRDECLNREEGETEKEGRETWHLAFHGTKTAHVR